MKRGKEIGILPISGLKNKNKTTELYQLLYDINDFLYFFSNLYISYSVKEHILQQLTEYAVKFKELDIDGNSKSNDTREEILFILRGCYKELKKYQYDDIKENTVDTFNKMCKYLVALYLKDKNTLTIDDKLKWIKKIKLYSEFYPISNSLESVQNELLEEFIVHKS